MSIATVQRNPGKLISFAIVRLNEHRCDEAASRKSMKERPTWLDNRTHVLIGIPVVFLCVLLV